jgi:5-formyltetrahydrofolate cyclo-ligase
MEKAKEEKRETRERAGRLLKSLPKFERAAMSEAACRNLVNMPELRASRAILLYAPLPDELDIWPALHAFADAGKRIILPKCQPEQHEMLCIEVGDFKHDLIRGTFNILEPKCDIGVSLPELDVAIAPGRAFDRAGNRVGRGVGYYDRFFIKKGFRAFKCGIAFDCQLFPEVPVEAHDIPMDAVVTESGLIRADRSGGAEPDER